MQKGGLENISAGHRRCNVLKGKHEPVFHLLVYSGHHCVWAFYCHRTGRWNIQFTLTVKPQHTHTCIICILYSIVYILCIVNIVNLHLFAENWNGTSWSKYIDFQYTMYIKFVIYCIMYNTLHVYDFLWWGLCSFRCHMLSYSVN